MGAIGRGKTTTGVQIALDLARQAQIPFLFIDPKGEFVANGRPTGAFAGLPNVGALEAGTDPVPLDFLPRRDSGQNKIARAAMRLRDPLVLCCKSPGDLQKDFLRTAIERVITDGGDRNLETVRDAYEQDLRTAGKENDSIVSRLNELTHLSCFEAKFQPAQFFSQSWAAHGVHGLPELKRLLRRPRGSTETAPENIVGFQKVVAEFFDFVIAHEPALHRYFIERKTTPAKERRRNRNLVFRPIGLELLARLYVHFFRRERLYVFQWALQTLSWKNPGGVLDGTVWINKKIQTKGKKLAIDYVLYLLSELSSREHASLRNKLRDFRNDPSYVLPPPLPVPSSV